MSSAKKPMPVFVVAAAISSDPRSAAASARNAGFAGLQFDAVTSSLDLTDFSASARRQFRQMLTQNNQSLVGLRTDAGPKGLMPGADVDRALWRWNRVLEAAAGLEARLVCLELGPLPEPPIVPIEKPAYSPDQLGLIILPTPPQGAPTSATSSTTQSSPANTTTPADLAAISHVDSALGELGRLADRFGVVVALRTELSTLAALQRAIAAAACPWFGVDLDPVALLQDDSSPDQIFSRLGPLIRHVRARDALAGTARRTRPMPLGKGSTDWRSLLALLDEASFHGPITVDPLDLTDRPAGAAAGLKHLRSFDEKPRNSE